MQDIRGFFNTSKINKATVIITVIKEGKSTNNNSF